MASPDIIVLDVGHGNCTLIRDKDHVGIVDAPPGSTLLDTLRELCVTEIESIVLSHADMDHIAGVSALLASNDISVKKLYVNSDASKFAPNGIWTQLRVSVADARGRGDDFSVNMNLNTDIDAPITVGGVQLEVLAPSPDLIMGGVGSCDVKTRRKITSNSISAVLRITQDGTGYMLLPGDIDAIGLNSLIDEGMDATAKVLVFPHHGGLPSGMDVNEFTKQLCRKVAPNMVVFSNSRGRFSNPRPEVVAAVQACSTAEIACTQLAQKCMDHTDECDFSHLSELPASGKQTNSCCAGSLHFKLEDADLQIQSNFTAYKQFLADSLKSPLCKRISD